MFLYIFILILNTIWVKIINKLHDQVNRKLKKKCLGFTPQNHKKQIKMHPKQRQIWGRFLLKIETD